MAGFANLKVSGQQKLIKDIKKIAKKLQNKRGVYLASVIAYERWVKKNFRAQGKNHDDAKFHWKPLTESTIARRRKKSSVILRDTGNLMMRWDRTATNNFGRLRSAQNYSSTHENGDRRRKIPQRKIFPTDKQGRKIVAPVFENFVKKAMK